MRYRLTAIFKRVKFSLIFPLFQGSYQTFIRFVDALADVRITFCFLGLWFSVFKTTVSGSHESLTNLTDSSHDPDFFETHKYVKTVRFNSRSKTS